MRQCLRCETTMVEDLAVMVTNGGYGVDVREKGLVKWYNEIYQFELVKVE